MAGALVAERVRRDIDVVSRAGLDLETFIQESLGSLARALPFTAACLSTVDPGSRLLTGAHKYGDLVGRDEHDHEFGLLEYGEVEPTTYVAMVDRDVDSAGVHQLTGGRVEESPRIQRFMAPYFGYTDELRGVFRDRGQLWGGMALFRHHSAGPFTADEVDFLARLTQSFARGVRAGLLAHFVSAPSAAYVDGPAVLVVDAGDRVDQLSEGAERWLQELVAGGSSSSSSSVVSGMVAAARRYARGESDTPPRARVRARNGMWLVLNASPLTGSGGLASGNVVVTIEEARPPEIVPLVVAAFDLTPRERDVTQLVLQGVDTKEIATTMHVSPYTVQDHLKSVFEKASVRSRRELIARIYFDQYVPRLGRELAPSGWFARPQASLGSRVSEMELMQ